MTTVVKVQANLVWRAERGSHSDRWIAFCDPLGISTEADTLDELHSVIPEAIHILMLDLFEDNEFDAFLRERGWTATRAEQPTQDGEATFHVPWELLVQHGSHDTARKSH